MRASGAPAWAIALALAVFFSAAAAVVAVAHGALLMLLPAFAVVGLGYGLYATIVARRRRAGFDFTLPQPRQRIFRRGRPLRGPSRARGDSP